jgi:hypothetical protein
MSRAFPPFEMKVNDYEIDDCAGAWRKSRGVREEEERSLP